MPFAVHGQGEYGLDGLFTGMPVRLGRDGVEEIIEGDLNDEEQRLMDTSAEHVRSNPGDLQRLRDEGEIG